MRTRTVCLAATVLLGLASVIRAADEVKEGQPAPDFTLQATHASEIAPGKKDGDRVSLKDVKDKNIVLFFYPKAMTRGCTVESCGFRDRIKKFEDLDTVVIGISCDKLEDQQKFTEKENLNFPLLADPDKKVTEAFGALNPERGLPSRYTYVIDKKGVVRKVYKTVTPARHPDEVLDYIKENLK